MKPWVTVSRPLLLTAVLAGFMTGGTLSGAPSATASSGANAIRIAELQGTVELSPAGATTWVLTQTNQVVQPSDRLRTGTNSRVALVWSTASGQSVLQFGALTEIEIQPPAPGAAAGLKLLRGLLSFFHRDHRGNIRVITRGAVAGVEGTEFALAIEPTNPERTILSVIDGQVQFTNTQGALTVTNGQQAVAEPDKAPRRTPGFIANNVLQWCFYYPAVLDLRELPLTSEVQQALSESLAAYRQGDLLAALDKYPAGRQAGSDAERIYRAALLLSVGQVEQTEDLLAVVPADEPTERLQRLARALRQLIAAVKRQPNPSTLQPLLATEFLAASYYEQSRAVRGDSLTAALHLASQAATNSPEFGFAWERVAELEFSFGRTSRALEALNKSLALSSRNAQAIALQGFLFAAQNKISDAIKRFDQAIAVDSALGNAWLGRGLCRIRRGDARGGGEDLLVAAALEPQRAGLRSYLGKAWSDSGDDKLARNEFDLARKLDQQDPTSWLYSALNNQRENRINEAIGDLEKSQALNDNRRLYRSQLLLDQDRAVRSANLARIYQDAGMDEVAFREAVRAVNADYANYSAHLFLANSYQRLQDPNFINLRYETAVSSEYLLANLLAPADAGWLSPSISQQEYSRLFQRDGLGVFSSTEYLSRGAWIQSGAQYGQFGNTSYSLDAFYRTDPGQWPNGDTEQRLLALALKQNLSPDDHVVFQISQNEIRGGDIGQRYDPQQFAPDFRFEDKQEPDLTVGYDHRWAEGIHTLLLGNYISERLKLSSTAQQTFLAGRLGQDWSAFYEFTMGESLRVAPRIYAVELQQVFQVPRSTTVFGGRFQYGHYRVNNFQDGPSSTFGGPFDPAAPDALQFYDAMFRRFDFYGYESFRIVEPLQLIAGISYDNISYPENFRDAPVSGLRRTMEEVSPKAGFIWTPLEGTTVRGSYTRSLAGPAGDQSLQLEPSQVAGFVQSFRSLVSESIVGAHSGASFETFGLALDQKFRSGTYLGIGGEILFSHVDRTVGGFDAFGPTPPDFWAVPLQLQEQLDYRERSLGLTLNQLVGDTLAFGARYRLTQSLLYRDFSQVPDGLLGDVAPRTSLESESHQITLDALFNHPSGFFAGLQGIWILQSNGRALAAMAGDDVWQFNFFAGYRFAHRRAELGLGLLNLFDHDYRLTPLTPYGDLPRNRTLLVRFQFNF